MFRIIKDSSYIIFKMFINQIAMTLFGLILGFATWNYDKLSVVASVFAIVFYLVLLYTMTWDYGYEESQLIESGRIPYVKLKGLIMSLCANFINIVLGIMALVGYYGASGYTFYNASGEIITDIASAVGKAPSSPEWAVNVFGIGKTVSTFLNGMYSGIISAFFRYSPWIFILLIIPSVIVCTIAYIMGVKGKHFTKLLGGKPNME